MFSKKEIAKPIQPETGYQIAVCVQETNEQNGPGHVSIMLIEEKKGEKITHPTSFLPTGPASIFNALTLGSVPVSGQVAKNHRQDVAEADHVLVISISQDRFQQARKAQTAFEDAVNEGTSMYSVFGHANPLATLFKTVFNGYQGAQQTITNHKERTGSHPSEDMCGIHVYPDIDHATHPPKMKIYNCVTSTTHILRKAGFRFSSSTIVPTLFPSVLEKQGFTKVSKETFTVTHCRNA